jgi:hypothetical protein
VTLTGKASQVLPDLKKAGDVKPVFEMDEALSSFEKVKHYAESEIEELRFPSLILRVASLQLLVEALIETSWEEVQKELVPIWIKARKSEGSHSLRFCLYYYDYSILRYLSEFLLLKLLE